MSAITDIQKQGANQRRGSRTLVLRPWSEISPVRRWVLVWPREHGAWGILLVSLITGAAIGLSSATNIIPLLWLLLVTLAAFCLRTPIENAMPKSPFRPRTQAEWRWVSVAALVYVLAGVLAGFMLWFDGALRLIWMLAPFALALFALQAMIKRLGRAFRLPSEIIAVFGMTLAAAAGYIVASGKTGNPAIGLWLLNGLFAANQVLYVQFRIGETRDNGHPSSMKRKRIFLATQGATVLAIMGGARAGWLPGMAIIAFVPLFVRGSIWSLRSAETPLRIHRLGKTELAHAILFGLLLIAASHIS
jgi:hypothetical protein